MTTAIKKIVTVQPGGLVEVRSPDLREGDQAEVTVVVRQPAGAVPTAPPGWRRYAGAINSNDLRAADNQRIDADLADEYGGHSKAGP